MNVAELRELVNTTDLPDEAEVVLSKDAEGNDYSPLDRAESMFYEPETTYSGEVYDHDCDGDGPPASAKPALVLWPVN